MGYDEVAARFEGCAAFARWPPERVRAVVSAVRTLEPSRHVRSLAALCATG
jgi:hypothetical protein